LTSTSSNTYQIQLYKALHLYLEEALSFQWELKWNHERRHNLLLLNLSVYLYQDKKDSLTTTYGKLQALEN